jgi:hypothetical protein
MIAVSIFSALVHHWCSPLLWSNCGQLPSSEAALRLRQQSRGQTTRSHARCGQRGCMETGGVIANLVSDSRAPSALAPLVSEHPRRGCLRGRSTEARAQV